MPLYCTRALKTGVCHIQGCKDRHKVYECQICGRFMQPDTRRSHENGEHHAKKVRARQRQQQQQQQRLASAPPRRPAAASAPAINPTVQPATPETYPCEVCKEQIPVSARMAHETLTSHVRRQAEHDRLLYERSDKHGIKVSWVGNGVNFGVVGTSSPGTSISRIISVTNVDGVRPDRMVLLREIKKSSFMLNDRSEASFTVQRIGKKQRVVFGKERKLQVNFQPRFAGLHRAILILSFYDQGAKLKFAITRHLEAIVGSEQHIQLAQPTAPYIGPAPLRPRVYAHQIDHTLLPSKDDEPKRQYAPTSSNLGYFDPPREVLDLAFGDSPNSVRELMPTEFSSDTYAEFFQIPLWIEEEQNAEDLRRYGMERVRLQPTEGGLYKLVVPGLAEKRPSVLRGDTILVKKSSSPGAQWNKGIVRVVLEKAVMIRLHGSLRFTENDRVNVQFTLNRLPYRRYHEAVTTRRENVERLLFPPPVPVGIEHGRAQLAGRFFDPQIESNQRQKEAVERIYELPMGSGPFVIWGPPGTGKTVTIVEAILQLLRKNPRGRVFACAPSNSAADIIAQRLSKAGIVPRDMFRLNAYSRNIHSLPKDPSLEDYVLIGPGNAFEVPPLQELLKYRVVITTCVSAGVLHARGVPRGHYQYIFVDEAAQSHEPEATIAMKGLADEKTNLILSGDPMQLRPILRSSLVKRLGLEKSYLERLVDVFNNRADLEDGQRPSVQVIRLQDHYRSHPDIIKFPNDAFYNSELRNCAPRDRTHSLLGFKGLIKKDVPIIFHAMTGEDAREGSSPSFFNMSEASAVVEYYQKLIGQSDLRLTHDDIGIIAPYQAQKMKIRRLIDDREHCPVVGSVEEFQGQERKVIIISTVRSSVKYLQMDVKHHLGFVADIRRLNVAITRAKALLIIVGDPVVLALDETWRKFLNYVHQKGGWTGKDIDWDPLGPVVRNRQADGRAALEQIAEAAKEEHADIPVPPSEAGDDDDGAEDRDDVADH